MAPQSASDLYQQLALEAGDHPPVHHVAPCRARAATANEVTRDRIESAEPIRIALVACGTRARFAACYELTVTEKSAPHSGELCNPIHSYLTAVSG